MRYVDFSTKAIATKRERTVDFNTRNPKLKSKHCASSLKMADVRRTMTAPSSTQKFVIIISSMETRKIMPKDVKSPVNPFTPLDVETH